jgi:hypothetical protein
MLETKFTPGTTSGTHYLTGDADTDGSIRLRANGSTVVIERRDSGTWICLMEIGG